MKTNDVNTATIAPKESELDELVSKKAKEIVIALNGLSYNQSQKALDRAKMWLEDMPIKFEPL